MFGYRPTIYMPKVHSSPTMRVQSEIRIPAGIKGHLQGPFVNSSQNLLDVKTCSATPKTMREYGDSHYPSVQ